MRIVNGLLVLATGAFIGSYLHVIPTTDPAGQVSKLTRIFTAPPAEPANLEGWGVSAQPQPRVAAAPPGASRTFSPDSPVFSEVTSSMGAITTGAITTSAFASPPSQPRESAATSGHKTIAAVRAEPTVLPVAADPSLAQLATKPLPGKVTLIKSLQEELRRVGCYAGNVDGSWGNGSRRAMNDFVRRVNASLPVDRPDFVLLALVQSHSGQVCNSGCPTGQVMGEASRCIPSTLLTDRATTAADIRTASATTTSAAGIGVVPLPVARPDPASIAAASQQRIAPVSRALAAVAQPSSARAGTSWSSGVTITRESGEAFPSQPSWSWSRRTTLAAAPLPGRMSIGAAGAENDARGADALAPLPPATAGQAAENDDMRERARPRAYDTPDAEPIARSSRYTSERRAERKTRATRTRSGASRTTTKRVRNRAAGLKRRGAVRSLFFGSSGASRFSD